MASGSGDTEHVRRWEPMDGDALPCLRLLEETGTTGVPVSKSPALVDAIERVSPDGRPVTTFGAAFVFEGDRDEPLSPEVGQPARWWSLAEPPERRREHLWGWMVEHLALVGPLPDRR